MTPRSITIPPEMVRHEPRLAGSWFIIGEMIGKAGYVAARMCGQTSSEVAIVSYDVAQLPGDEVAISDLPRPVRDLADDYAESLRIIRHGGRAFAALREIAAAVGSAGSTSPDRIVDIDGIVSAVRSAVATE